MDTTTDNDILDDTKMIKEISVEILDELLEKGYFCAGYDGYQASLLIEDILKKYLLGKTGSPLSEIASNIPREIDR